MITCSRLLASSGGNSSNSSASFLEAEMKVVMKVVGVAVYGDGVCVEPGAEDGLVVEGVVVLLPLPVAVPLVPRRECPVRHPLAGLGGIFLKHFFLAKLKLIGPNRTNLIKLQGDFFNLSPLNLSKSQA